MQLLSVTICAVCHLVNVHVYTSSLARNLPLFLSLEERRANDKVLFTSENNDTPNQSVHASFFTSEKNCMTNQLPSLARRDYFYVDGFWCVNLGRYIIKVNTLFFKRRCQYVVVPFFFCLCTILATVEARSFFSIFANLKRFERKNRVAYHCISSQLWYFEKFTLKY